jgi:hypothetical protein
MSEPTYVVDARVYDAEIISEERMTPVRRLGIGATAPTTVIATPTMYSLKTTAAIAVGALLTGGIVGWYARGKR